MKTVMLSGVIPPCMTTCHTGGVGSDWGLVDPTLALSP